MTPARPADTVALFNTRFLPYSQTFVYEEIRCHERYAVEVFCRSRLLPDRFPFEPVHVGGPLYAIACRSAAFDARFRARGFALVHAHFGLGAVYARPFARRHRLPLVVTFHGYDGPLLAHPRRWLPQHLRYALFGPRVLHDMTLGLCASTELRDLLLAQGVPPDRLRVHHLGIDLDGFTPAARDPAGVQVVMIGRFVEKKGFEYGLRGFAAAARQEPSLWLTVVGEGEREPALRALVKAEGMGERVTFTGALPHERVARLLATSHILLAPSVVSGAGDRESGLIVVKEASASETVPIGTRHGGIPEIIDDGETGFLVPERDPGALADRLLKLTQDPGLRERMGRAARQKMQREYDNRGRVRALEALYDEARALHGGAGRPGPSEPGTGTR
jgi:glycosyltransferase involved in cell wall biosynthesis